MVCGLKELSSFFFKIKECVWFERNVELILACIVKFLKPAIQFHTPHKHCRNHITFGKDFWAGLTRLSCLYGITHHMILPAKSVFILF